MSTHTPGNWVAESDGEYWNVIVEGVEGFGREIVGCEGLYRCDGSDEANARLIAAAPELLGALQRLVDAVDPESTGWDEAVAAIAKATGK